MDTVIAFALILLFGMVLGVAGAIWLTEVKAKVTMAKLMETMDTATDTLLADERAIALWMRIKQNEGGVDERDKIYEKHRTAEKSPAEN